METVNNRNDSLELPVNMVEGKAPPLSYPVPPDFTDSLPPESIAEIILWARDGSTPGKRITIVTKLSLVCKRWRSIALQDARLWSVIDLVDESAVEICLSRSAEAPLHLSFSLISPTLIFLASQVIHRTRTLVVQPGSELRVSGTLHCSEARLLQELDICLTILPVNSFAHGNPPLKKLRLTGCAFSWNTPLFPVTLTTLHISCPHNRLSVDGLVEILKGMPSLVRLKLHNVFEPLSNSGRITPIIFPSISQVGIAESHCIPSIQLFGMCTFPLATNVLCHVDVLEDASCLLQSIFESLGDLTPAYLKVYLAYNRPHNESYISMATGKQERRVRLSTSYGDSSSLFLGSLDLLPLQNLQMLACAWVADDIDMAWIEVIGSLPQLRSLVLGNAAALDFIQCLPLGSDQFPAIRRVEFNVEIEYEQDLEFYVDWSMIKEALKEMHLAEVCFIGEMWEIVDLEDLIGGGCRVSYKGWTSFNETKE